MDDTTAMRKLAQMMLIICVHCVTFLARYCDHNEAAVFPLLSGGRRLVRGEQESRSSECGPQWSPSPRHQLLGPCSGHWSWGMAGVTMSVSVVCMKEQTNDLIVNNSELQLRHKDSSSCFALMCLLLKPYALCPTLPLSLSLAPTQNAH